VREPAILPPVVPAAPSRRRDDGHAAAIVNRILKFQFAWTLSRAQRRFMRAGARMLSLRRVVKKYG